jgi:hypothetical protein
MKPLALLLLLLSFPLAAQQRNEVAVSFGRTEFETAGDTPAVGASYNRFWTRYVSTRAGIFSAGEDRSADGFHGETRFTAVYATVEYHPFRGRLLSPRAAGGLAAGRFHDEFAGFGQTDSQVTGIFGAGLDVNLTRRFALGLEVAYLPFNPEPRDRFSAPLDPLTTLASTRFRW